MQFEFNNKALKWNMPIGVQFDTMSGLTSKKDQILWSIIFHYKDNPIKQHESFKSCLKAYSLSLIHSLKESQSLRVENANEILSHLSKQDENKMIIEGLFKN